MISDWSIEGEALWVIDGWLPWLPDYCACVCVHQFNFVGRILGPRGLTAKQLEAETGCKIMVRGRGSMRDRKKVTHTHKVVSFCLYGDIH